MTYTLIQPPFTLKFREMSKKELKDYYQWFMAILPDRLDELCQVVKQTSGFQNWTPDFTPDSLNILGEWFLLQVETRKRSQEELQEMKNQQTFPIDIHNEELTDRTFSLAIDIGMYFSQVLIKNNPSLSWKQPFGNKKFADYGQPLLTGFGVVSLNPIRIATSLAYGLSDRTRNGKRLREIYDYGLTKI